LPALISLSASRSALLYLGSRNMASISFSSSASCNALTRTRISSSVFFSLVRSKTCLATCCSSKTRGYTEEVSDDPNYLFCASVSYFLLFKAGLRSSFPTLHAPFSAHGRRRGILSVLLSRVLREFHRVLRQLVEGDSRRSRVRTQSRLRT
jgi:hypothetical protein